MKPRLGQGRAGLRCKIKTIKPLTQVKEKQPLPNITNIQDIAIPIPNFAKPQVKSRGNTMYKNN